jgi:AbrB family looped-hinge helix DNA binding protein
MEISMDEVGRLVIPKPVRQRLGVQGSTRLELTEVEGGVVLTPATDGPRLVERDGILVAEREGSGPLLDWRAVREVLERHRR